MTFVESRLLCSTQKLTALYQIKTVTFTLDPARPGITAPADKNPLLDPTRPVTDPEKMAEQDKLREALDPYKNLKDYNEADGAPTTSEERLKAKINEEQRLKAEKGEPVTNDPDPNKVRIVSHSSCLR